MSRASEKAAILTALWACQGRKSLSIAAMSGSWDGWDAMPSLFRALQQKDSEGQPLTEKVSAALRGRADKMLPGFNVESAKDEASLFEADVVYQAIHNMGWAVPECPRASAVEATFRAVLGDEQLAEEEQKGGSE